MTIAELILQLHNLQLRIDDVKDRRNFTPIFYLDAMNRNQMMYEMTSDGRGTGFPSLSRKGRTAMGDFIFSLSFFLLSF